MGKRGGWAGHLPGIESVEQETMIVASDVYRAHTHPRIHVTLASLEPDPSLNHCPPEPLGH